MGRRYREWEDKHGIFLPVRSCWADYVKSARYDDLVTVRTSVSDISKASITFFYEILLSETGDLLATGGTRHAFITRDGRITRSAMALLPELFESTSRVKSSSQR
jgi:acyl-CoA thioester hydrolase